VAIEWGDDKRYKLRPETCWRTSFPIRSRRAVQTVAAFDAPRRLSAQHFVCVQSRSSVDLRHRNRAYRQSSSTSDSPRKPTPFLKQRCQCAASAEVFSTLSLRSSANQDCFRAEFSTSELVSGNGGYRSRRHFAAALSCMRTRRTRQRKRKRWKQIAIDVLRQRRQATGTTVNKPSVACNASGEAAQLHLMHLSGRNRKQIPFQNTALTFGWISNG